MIRPALVSEVRRVTEFMKAFEQASATVKVDVDYSVKRYEDFVSSGKGQMLMLLDDRGELQGSLGFLIAPDIHTGVRSIAKHFLKMRAYSFTHSFNEIVG